MATIRYRSEYGTLEPFKRSDYISRWAVSRTSPTTRSEGTTTLDFDLRKKKLPDARRALLAAAFSEQLSVMSNIWVNTTLVNDLPSGAISIARVTRVIPSKTPQLQGA